MPNSFLDSFEAPPATEMRDKCWNKFMALGLPTKLHEDFQYMPLKDLANASYKKAQEAEASAKEGYSVTFVNGYIRTDLSSLPKGAILLPLNQAFKSYGVLLNNRYSKHVLESTDPFALLNAAQAQQGAFLYLPPKLVCADPIEIHSIITGSGWVMPRLHVFVGKLAEVSLTSSQTGSGCFYNAHMDFELDDEAKVNFIHTGSASEGFRFDSFYVTLKRNSQFKAVQLSNAGQTRHNWHLALAGEGANAEVSGLWLLDGQKSNHTNVVIEHQAPHTTSMQLFKGVLDDEAISSFQGKIYVHKIAQKTQAYQRNNNLILSGKATANSKPNLEIFADDVKASHGATVGQLDKDQLFYLTSRGIAPDAARSLLVRGFCEEVLAKVPNHVY